MGALTVGALPGAYLPEPVVDPVFLRLAGDALAYRTPFGISLSSSEDNDGNRPGSLFGAGPFRLDVARGHELVLHGPGWTRWLDWAITECGVSSSGCSGIDMVQQAGDRFAVHDTGVSREETVQTLTVYDRDGHATTECGDTVVRFVLAPDGAVACSAAGSIYSAGQLLDSGPDVDPYSLVRRGDAIVWRRGGVEKSAPLPTAPG